MAAGSRPSFECRPAAAPFAQTRSVASRRAHNFHSRASSRCYRPAGSEGAKRAPPPPRAQRCAAAATGRLRFAFCFRRAREHALFFCRRRPADGFDFASKRSRPARFDQSARVVAGRGKKRQTDGQRTERGLCKPTDSSGLTSFNVRVTVTEPQRGAGLRETPRSRVHTHSEPISGQYTRERARI
jgi:hypothetical protein